MFEPEKMYIANCDFNKPVDKRLHFKTHSNFYKVMFEQQQKLIIYIY